MTCSQCKRSEILQKIHLQKCVALVYEISSCRPGLNCSGSAWTPLIDPASIFSALPKWFRAC